MKPKDLLTSLDSMESLLGDFSYEELDTARASQLKKSFESFKQELTDQIFGGVPTTSENTVLPKMGPDPVQRTVPSPNMLIAKVSHEIRTPLNGIIGFTDLLKEDGLQPDQLEKVNAIQSASFNLLEIINELLEYSKLASGTAKFESVDFHFRNVIQEVLYLCDTLITDKNVALEVVMEPNIPEILVGDPSKLSQILLNLLGNAIKFVEKGTIVLKIATERQIRDHIHVHFSISDTGIGIPEDKLATIFDPFQQAGEETFPKYGGSGLGLHIVKQLIDNLHGTISVDSTLGLGTTFSFMLPYAEGSAQKVLTKGPLKEVGKDPETTIKDLRVMVFEDNPLNQRLIEQRLKAWGCRVFLTENGLQGIELLENHPMDLVLMDLRMPGMDGFETTERIRQSKEAHVQKIPVIALSADFSLRDREKCEELGIRDFILKPYNPATLLEKLVDIKKEMKMDMDQKLKQARPHKDPNSGEVDLSPVLEDCMGEVGLLEELVQLYKSNALEFIGAAKSHISLGDFKELALAAHKIKAGLAMMQSHNLLEIVEQVQKACAHEGDLKHLQFLYSCFLEEYPRTEQKIDAALVKIKKEGI